MTIIQYELHQHPQLPTAILFGHRLSRMHMIVRGDCYDADTGWEAIPWDWHGTFACGTSTIIRPGNAEHQSRVIDKLIVDVIAGIDSAYTIHTLQRFVQLGHHLECHDPPTCCCRVQAADRFLMLLEGGKSATSLVPEGVEIG